MRPDRQEIRWLHIKVLPGHSPIGRCAGNAPAFPAADAAFEADTTLSFSSFVHSARINVHRIRSLRVGGVIVNETCTWRPDQLAYGAVKARASGAGREGPRYAIEDMTEQRLIVFNL